MKLLSRVAAVCLGVFVAFNVHISPQNPFKVRIRASVGAAGVVAAPYIPSESLGAKLRRLARNADATNPIIRGAMASPPTLTSSATHITALSVFVPRSTNLFRYIGANQASGVFTTSAQGGTSAWAVEFDTDAPKFEIWANCGGGCPGGVGSSRLFVDGWAVSLSPLAMPQGNPFSLVDFTSAGGRKMRHFRFETGSASTTFTGLQVAPYDTVAAAPVADSVRAIFAGDSITAGTGASYFSGAYVHTAAKFLGWDDPWASGAAGTGYLAPGTSVPLASRLSADVVANHPDVVVFPMGVNDVPYSTPTAIQAAAAAVFTTARAALPNAFFVVVGPWGRTDQTSAAQQAVSTAIKSGLLQADAAGVAAGRSCFVETIATNWLTGTGSDTAPAGNGNADYYISGATGQPHPNQAGHDYYGRLLAQAIRTCEAALP